MTRIDPFLELILYPLLQAYGENPSESESEATAAVSREAKPSSRRRRLRVARVLGITNTQLNFSLMSL